MTSMGSHVIRRPPPWVLGEESSAAAPQDDEAPTRLPEPMAEKHIGDLY
jgi:hypothetical protein